MSAANRLLVASLAGRMCKTESVRSMGMTPNYF